MLNIVDGLSFQLIYNFIYKKVILDMNLGIQYNEYEEQDVVNALEYALYYESTYSYIPSQLSFTAVESLQGAFYNKYYSGNKHNKKNDDNAVP